MVGEGIGGERLMELMLCLVSLKKVGFSVVINTGRDLAGICHTLDSLGIRCLPDYIVAQEGFIWASSDKHCSGIDCWNREREQRLDALFQDCFEFFSLVKAKIAVQTGKCKWWHRPGDPAGVRSTEVSDMDSFCRWLDDVLPLLNTPDLCYQRNGRYMRFTHSAYSKGTALRLLMSLRGLVASQSFAIGDGHNDLSMLDAGICANLACPGNAVQEVIERVRCHHGHVSAYQSTAGCIDSLQWFIERVQLT